MASEFEDCCEKVMDGVENLKLFVEEEISGRVKCVGTHNCPTPKGDDTGILKESTNILDPLVTRSKGRPPSKRKQSTVEKIVKKIQKKGNKTRSNARLKVGDFVH